MYKKEWILSDGKSHIAIGRKKGADKKANIVIIMDRASKELLHLETFKKIIPVKKSLSFALSYYPKPERILIDCDYYLKELEGVKIETLPEGVAIAHPEESFWGFLMEQEALMFGSKERVKTSDYERLLSEAFEMWNNTIAEAVKEHGVSKSVTINNKNQFNNLKKCKEQS